MSDTLSKARELRQQRVELVEQAGKILDPAVDEGRELTTEEEEKWTKLHKDAEKLLTRAERIEKQYEAEEEDARSAGTVVGANGMDDGGESRDGDDEESVKEAYEEAFRRYLQGGMTRLRSRERDLLEQNYTAFSDEQRAEFRDMGVATDVGGGFVVPEGFLTVVEEAMLQFGGFREFATVLRTASGNDLPMPTMDDTSNKGAILSENDPAPEQDIAFGRAVLHAHVYTSKMVPVSRQLLQDSAVDLDDILGRALGTRIGRITAEHFTTGDGSSKPYGIITQATSAVTAASATALDWDELYDLKHGVDPAYRKGGRARWMFNDATLKALKKIKDGNGNPLWQPGVAVREPDTIDGDGYVVNQEMADIAASAKPIGYGDLSKYHIRDVLGFTLLRLEERFAEQFQVAFLGFSRHDGLLLDAGTNPFKVMTMASS